MGAKVRKGFDTVSLDMIEEETGQELADPQALNIEDDVLSSIDFERALATLPEREREIFQRVAIEGYTQQEEADRLGIHNQRVSEILVVVRRKIQDFLDL